MSLMKRIKELLRSYSSIISSVEEFHYIERPHISVIRAKVVLIDSSVLYIREIWRDEEKVAYSYYWIDPDGNLIEGWDNAPHHPEVDTFPDHAHTRMGVKQLPTPSLGAFLGKIRRLLR